MKKVILGILSVLFISPVFADSIDMNQKFNSFISFESLKSDYNITYGSYIFSNSYGANQPLYFYYLNNDFSPNYSLNYFDSPSTQSGQYFDTSLGFPFTSSSDISTGFEIKYPYGYINAYYGMLGIGKNNNKLLSNQFSIYFQKQVGSSLPNRLLNFGGEFQSDFFSPNNAFIRALYNYDRNSEIWFSSGVSPSQLHPTSPSDIQLFTYSHYIYTTKGRAVFPGYSLNKISPSVGNGFSFIPDLSDLNDVYYDDLMFFSVLPYWDSSWSSSSSLFNIPSSAYINGVYIFKNNSLGRDTDRQNIGVISKCSIDLCSGFDLTSYLSSLVVSEYICDFSQNFSLKTNCILVGGGILYNILGNITGLNSKIDVSSLPFIFKGLNTSSAITLPGLGVNFSFGSNPYLLKFQFYSYNGNFGISTATYNITYTGGYTLSNNPDILGVTDFIQPVGPQEPLTTGGVVDVLDTLCKSALIKPAFCYNGGVDTISTGLDGMWYVDLSGNLVYTIIGTDPDNLGSFDLVPNGSGGFDVVCTDDLFGCSLVNNVGFSGSSVGGSGYILSPLYYEKFFTETGYWGSCPYPYTDVNVGLRSKVLNKLGDKLGFDIFLPINCTIAAFVHGKNYKFLSDVNLGLNPLMGNIQNSDDPRVYLYRFFDFLLSFALFVFLLKIYHLLN